MKTSAYRRKNVKQLTASERADQLIREVAESVVFRKSQPAAWESMPAKREAEPQVLRQPEVLTRAETPPKPAKATLALICYEDGGSLIGQQVSRTARMLADRNVAVHIFARSGFDAASGIHVHHVGMDGSIDASELLGSVAEFTSRVRKAFVTSFAPEMFSNVTVLGHEWTSIPALLGLKLNSVLSLHSLECQRSDMSSELSRKIQEIETQGLLQSGAILLHDAKTNERARTIVPDCTSRLHLARGAFPLHEFNSTLDAGAVKARFEVGPIDPTILFIGDLDERHGPDILMKAVPAILKNNKQARFIFVGDGALLWPLRVHARYLLLEHAVRFPGSVEGQALRELIQAADIIAVPSREKTEDWPILAAWASKRPVVATHEIGDGLLQHEQNGVLVYANENSCVWGCERLLFGHELRPEAGQKGFEQLQAKFGAGSAATQIQEFMGVKNFA